MSDKHLARRAETQVVIGGADVSVYVNRGLLSLTYTDNEEDEADDLQIKVNDRSGKWLKKWLNDIVINAAEGGTVIDSLPATSAVSGSSGSSGSSGEKVRYKVTASTGVNIRTGAGEKFKVIGKLPYGTIVEVSAFKSGWARISFSGKTGYIKGSNLKIVGGGGSTGTSKSKKSKTKAKIGGSNGGSGKGLKISAVIVLRNSNNKGKDTMLDCGEFELDSIDASGPPATVTIKATALSYSNSIRQTLKSKSWENITLSEITAEIARKNGMGKLFESRYNPKYGRVEQYQMSDIAFLQKLCHDAGCSLKATNNILVVFDQSAYEAKKAVKKIKYGETGETRYKISTGTNNVYTSCRVYCTAPDGTVISATEYAENYSETSDSQQCLQVCRKVSSKAEAQELAHKLLRLHNKYEITGSFTFPGDPKLAAGSTVELSGFGFGDGKYIIRQVKHNISSGGYTSQITIRKCLPAEEKKNSGTAADSDDKIQEIAMQVIRGEWDNYPKRKELLEAAGHSYEQVQARVNKILYGG